jgi:hypothetical protein
MSSRYRMTTSGQNRPEVIDTAGVPLLLGLSAGMDVPCELGEAQAEYLLQAGVIEPVGG